MKSKDIPKPAALTAAEEELEQAYANLVEREDLAAKRVQEVARDRAKMALPFTGKDGEMVRREMGLFGANKRVRLAETRLAEARVATGSEHGPHIAEALEAAIDRASEQTDELRASLEHVATLRAALDEIEQQPPQLRGLTRWEHGRRFDQIPQATPDTLARHTQGMLNCARPKVRAQQEIQRQAVGSAAARRRAGEALQAVDAATSYADLRDAVQVLNEQPLQPRLSASARLEIKANANGGVA